MGLERTAVSSKSEQKKSMSQDKSVSKLRISNEDQKRDKEKTLNCVLRQWNRSKKFKKSFVKKTV